MATIKDEKETPIVLRADIIDMGLLHLLESRYIVVVEKRGEDIVFELYKKYKDGNSNHC